MNNHSLRALVIVTLLVPSVALAAPNGSSPTPPAKHHRNLGGAVRGIASGIGGVAATTHGAPAPSGHAPQQSPSANGATGGGNGSFGNGSGTGNGSTSTPAPGSRLPVPSNGNGTSQPGRSAGPTRGGTTRPTPPVVTNDPGSVSSSGPSVSGSIGNAQQTLSMIEQAVFTAVLIAQMLHTDTVRGAHIPLPTHRTDPGSTRGSSTSTTDGSSTDGNDDSTDDSSSDTTADDSTDDSTSTASSSTPSSPSTSSTSPSSHTPANDPSTTASDSGSTPSTQSGAVSTGKGGAANPAPNDAGTVASTTPPAPSSTDSAPSSGTPLKSPSSGPSDSSSCELSKTKLPSVLDGTNAYCPTCVKGALDKLGDGVAQASTLSAGAMRERDTIEQIVKIEETGVASGDYGAISADGAKMEYGAYQFSRASGQLQGVLRTYIQMEGADAKSTGVLKSYLHTLESGAPLTGDHVFTDALRQAAKDPMMKKAQDAYFEREYLIPAIADASRMGLRSPLAAAVLVDLKTNGGYSSVVAAAKKAVPTIASADDEKKFIGALLDARDARYKALAAKAGLGQFLKTWMARDKDFRDILASGNTDLAGEVKLANGSFCGGNGDDSRAFSLFMAKQQQGATGTPGSTGTPALASI